MAQEQNGKSHPVVSLESIDEWSVKPNKAGYTATLVACGWAGVGLEKVTRAFGQER